MDTLYYFIVSMFIQIAHVQNQCNINENNNLMHGICCYNDTQNTKEGVAFNNVSLLYNSFYEYLTTEYSNNKDTELVAINDSKIEALPKEMKTSETNSFNFAAFDSGATVLSAASGIKSAKSILINRKDKYMMMPCDLAEKWFIIQLSEDIVLDRMEVMNLEHYSSNFKDIAIYARNDNHNDDDNDTNDAQSNWFFIANFKLLNKNTNTIGFEDNHWVRSLKIEILSFYGNEYYCTVTQIKVLGSTMLPHWKNELLSHLDAVDQIKQNITKNATKRTANNTKNKQETKTTNNKQQSVFTILTKRITSLELNLTKQQMEVTHLVDLFNEIKDLDQRFQVNLTNHMLFQSYGISMMLKTFKDNNNEDTENNNDDTDGTNTTNEDDSFRMYSDNWSSPKSYYNDVLSWKRHERLERIEDCMHNVLLIITSLYWIGLVIIVCHVIMVISIAVYVFKCCAQRHKKSRRRISSTKHRITPSSNNPLRKRFIFSKALASRSQSSSNIKRKNRKKIKK